MAKFLGNAFSAGMLRRSSNVLFRFVTVEEVKSLLSRHETSSCVGHADTALLISSLLGREIKMNRCSTELRWGDTLIVAQYNGPRLPEGATSLPEGASIRWIEATVEPDWQPQEGLPTDSAQCAEYERWHSAIATEQAIPR